MSSDISQDTIDNVCAATVHVPYHVTYAYGANFFHIFEISDPQFATTCMTLWLKQIELSAKTV